MNAPPRWKSFTIEDGTKKVSFEKDQKIRNAATFTIQAEDHTLGNLLRMQLLRNPGVIFAGYKNPHPLEHYIILKVQTVENFTPADAVQKALTELSGECAEMVTEFTEALTAGY